MYILIFEQKLFLQSKTIFDLSKALDVKNYWELWELSNYRFSFNFYYTMEITQECVCKIETNVDNSKEYSMGEIGNTTVPHQQPTHQTTTWGLWSLLMTQLTQIMAVRNISHL